MNKTQLEMTLSMLEVDRKALNQERDTYRDLCAELLKKLCESLPFVEDSLESNLFKPNFVKAKTKSIRELITKAESILGDKNGR